MSNQLTRIYALLVCFAAIICITITTGVALYDIVKIIKPELTISPWRIQHLQSNAAYRRIQAHPGMVINAPLIDESGRQVRPKLAVDDRTDAEIEQARQQELALLLETESRSAVASLVRLVIILIVSVPLYLLHWKLARRLEES